MTATNIAGSATAAYSSPTAVIVQRPRGGLPVQHLRRRTIAGVAAVQGQTLSGHDRHLVQQPELASPSSGFACPHSGEPGTHPTAP